MNRITALIDRHKVGPESLIREFDKYKSFVDRSETAFVESFLSADPAHSFEEYGALIDRYKQLSRAVLSEFDETAFTGFFEAHKREFIEHISLAAGQCEEMLLAKMINDYQLESKM